MKHGRQSKHQKHVQQVGLSSIFPFCGGEGEIVSLFVRQ